MVRILCLVCGKPIKIPQYIDTERYDGQVVCQECKSLLHVKLVKGKVQKYIIVENKFKDFNFTELIMRLQKERKQQEKGDSN